MDPDYLNIPQPLTDPSKARKDSNQQSVTLANNIKGISYIPDDSIPDPSPAEGQGVPSAPNRKSSPLQNAGGSKKVYIIAGIVIIIVIVGVLYYFMPNLF